MSPHIWRTLAVVWTSCVFSPFLKISSFRPCKRPYSRSSLISSMPCLLPDIFSTVFFCTWRCCDELEGSACQSNTRTIRSYRRTFKKIMHVSVTLCGPAGEPLCWQIMALRVSAPLLMQRYKIGFTLTMPVLRFSITVHLGCQPSTSRTISVLCAVSPFLWTSVRKG